MLIGPVFAREVAVAPRRPRLYYARTFYCLLLLLLTGTAYLVLTGTQQVRDLGDLARFGTILFQILAPLQLGLAMFFSAMLSASAVAQEKDRRTLILLLLTNLTNSELVLGKLLASLLNVLVLLTASVPLFMLTALFGGVSFAQIGRVFAVTVATVILCGSLGSLVALWREKTFQALAMTVLVLVFWLALWELVAAGLLFDGALGISHEVWAVGFSPWEAILEAARPYVASEPGLGAIGSGINLFLIVSMVLSLLLVGTAVLMVRRWNPSREARPIERDEHPQSIWNPTEPEAGLKASAAGAPSTPGVSADSSTVRAVRSRRVWDNPILWREVRTWAYGRKVLVIRIGYLVLFALAVLSLSWSAEGPAAAAIGSGWLVLASLFLLSLVLVNAQAVTSLTSERDSRAFDLLLVSDLTPKEFVYGKLGGVFYNTKEMILLPMALCGYLCHAGALAFEHLVYLVTALAILYGFVAMLGIHAGMAYENSRNAIGTSLGTVFFLFVGVATCIRIMLAFSGSFEAQLPFLGLVVFGGGGLFLALGVRNPSTAIGLASFACPLVTFYAITSLCIHRVLLAFVAIVVAYGFMTIAMLVPAIDEFDVATGRTTVEE